MKVRKEESKSGDGEGQRCKLRQATTAARRLLPVHECQAHHLQKRLLDSEQTRLDGVCLAKESVSRIGKWWRRIRGVRRNGRRCGTGCWRACFASRCALSASCFESLSCGPQSHANISQRGGKRRQCANLGVDCSDALVHAGGKCRGLRLSMRFSRLLLLHQLPVFRHFIQRLPFL
jgi:hypothetical protein